VHGDGKQSRDFTYVDNIVEANILAMKSINISGGVLNIANGKDFTILDLVYALNTIVKKNIKPVFTPKRRGDVFRTLADVSKAEKLLKFKSKVGFKEGLKSTVKWFIQKKQQ
jgi:UDP-glucose 4-epimerase